MLLCSMLSIPLCCQKAGPVRFDALPYLRMGVLGALIRKFREVFWDDSIDREPGPMSPQKLASVVSGHRHRVKPGGRKPMWARTAPDAAQFIIHHRSCEFLYFGRAGLPATAI
jgi:hypothetical protein